MADAFQRLSKTVRGQVDDVDLTGYTLLVNSLFSSPASIVPGGIAGVLTPFLCWLATGYDVFVSLTVLVALIVALRMMTVVAYRRCNHADDTYAQTRRWDRDYFLGATAFSAALGYSCYVALVQTDDAAAHITSVASTIALASGYVSRNAGRPKFVAVQLLIFCVPMAIGLIGANNPYYRYIGYFAFLYVAANIAITNSLHRNLLALSDATKQSKALASALHSQNLTLDAALNTMIDGLAMFDRGLKLAVSNKPHGALYGLPDTLTLPGTPLTAIARFLVERQVISQDQLRDIRSALVSVQTQQQPASREVVTRGGLVLVVTFAPAAEGGILMLTEDATERKRIAARIEQMARFDELTGLANRFEYNTQIADAFARLERTGEAFALLYVDLDGFKQVNDSLGHDVGDLVLMETASRLRNAVRGDDRLARFGGDEFLLILPSADHAAVTVIAQRMIDAMAKPFDADGKTVYVTASIGIAMAPHDGANPADLLRHADTALYKAKAAGRNALMFFNPAMAEEIMERHEIELDLRKACTDGSLELFYQPIIDLKTQKIVAREALMRWRHPVRGMVPAGVFIPIAEQSGLIGTMGDWAIRQACKDAAGWEPDVSVSVNVSALQFREPRHLVETVKDALLASHLASSRLTLEITESVLIDDNKQTLGVLQALREIGVSFALDDFGTGYSSLAYLSTYPIAQVKIDQSFARDVHVSEAPKAIIEAVCQLARRLQMNVVVEGIETDQQRIAVQLLGAHRAQGYLFGRPEALSTIRPQGGGRSVA
ncbi:MULTISPECIES: EAL domain-containing protein [unclassified Bosea (in: a-proteobacteria)]|uniref:putative bifunctional diguanylate cyclase/phosphodiesterase n=1 Tax=unclassified Bosea (in: a-proteobacteria) TaxID=2653178 RepID=UPI000953E301|nr:MULTISPECIES: EAL domain-containing protein [unclassified Bosea (in: a-proteobacteria)]TAJ27732.1 MAG: EAL domain-containing protein [Bosea sp. (in: a-proteobacteria)]SIQ11402.1 diguanylate cyclase/phosphodiesterase [Bosea sp. TND4EK4]